MKYKKKICFFSTNRADFNYIYSIFNFFNEKNLFDNFFIFNQNNNNSNILKDKKIDKKKLIKYKFKFLGNTESNIVDEISKFSKIVGKYLSNYKFDFIFIIGDRYEAHLIASIANVYNLPVVHIHGGEVTEGSYDDKFRHSITKLSSIHFAANKVYKRRIMQMGESKKHVFSTGSPTIDFLKNIKFYDRKFLSKFFNINFSNHNILVCYNSNKSIKSFIKKNKSKKNMLFFKDIGSKLFLSLLKESDLIIGNSSSAIIEAPYLGTASINIGERQKGRLMDNSVFNSDGSLISIRKNLNKVLQLDNNKIKKENYYGTGNSIKKMHKYMIKFSNTTHVHKKKFNDLKFK